MEYLFFLFFIIVFFVYLFNRYKLINILTNPFSLLVLMFVFIHLLSPILVLTLGVRSKYPELNYSNYIISFELLTYLSISFLALVVGYILFRKKDCDIKRLSKEQLAQFEDKYLYFLLIIFWVGSFIFLFKFGPIFLSDPSAFLSDRINQFSGFGYLKITTTFSSPIIVILYYKYIHTRLQKYLRLLIISVIIMIVTSIITGSRGTSVQPLLFICMFKLLFEYPQIKFSKILSIIIVFAVIFNFLTFLGEVRTNRGFKEDGISRSVLDEVVASFSHTEFLFKLTTMDIEPVYGKTYLSALAIPVPRALWNEKPVGGGPLLKNTLEPGSYSLKKQENNSSLTTGIFMEAYLNFGFIGAFLVPFIYGAIYAILLNIASKRNSIYKSYYIFFIIILFIILYPSGEFLGSCSRLFTYFFPFLLFAYIDRRNKNRYLHG